jgi:hypothetical protein
MAQDTVLEAAKFLKELQDEALNSISGFIRSSDNKISCEGVIYISGINTGRETDKYIIKLKINGVEETLEGEISKNDILAKDHKQILIHIANTILDKIRTSVLEKIGIALNLK